MFEKLRARIALNLFPFKATGNGQPMNLSSFVTPGQPVYSELGIKKATREGYKLSLYVYRCVRTVVNAASGIPWIVLDKKGNEIPDHDFTKAWAKPNSEFSGQDNMEFIIAHQKLNGNAILQPVYVNGRPKEFWICMPDLIQPIPSEVAGQWLKGWKVSDAKGEQKEVSEFIDEGRRYPRFIHLMQFDPGNPYWGIGDLQAAARTVDTDNEAQDTQKVSMQNRGIPSGIFKPDQDLNDEQLEERTRRIRELFLQKVNRREPWVLGNAWSWEAMSLTPVEMDYIQTRLANKQDIAAAFGVDPIFLGDKSQSTFNNIKEAKKALYENTVIPMLDDIRSTLNQKVAPLYGGDIFITYDLSNVSALRDDFKDKVEAATKLFSMGTPFSQINDKLEMGFEEFDGWDTSYLPFNLVPAGSSTQESQTAKMLTKALNLTTEEQKSNHWKRVDRRREAWVNVVVKKFVPLYEAEGKAVLKVIKGDDTSVLADKVSEAINGLSENWKKTIEATAKVLIDDFGTAMYQELTGTEKAERKAFEPFTTLVQLWIAQHAAEGVTSILATNLTDVKKVISTAVNEGQTVTQIAKQLRQYYDTNASYKAMRTARTEVSSAAGYGQREAARQSGVVKTKTWISSRDDRVRDSHSQIDGQTKPFDEKYSNGLMYPGDTSGRPEEFIQCRCAESYGTS